MYDGAQKAYEMCHGAQKDSFVVHDIHRFMCWLGTLLRCCVNVY